MVLSVPQFTLSASSSGKKYRDKTLKKNVHLFIKDKSHNLQEMIISGFIDFNYQEMQANKKSSGTETGKIV